MKRFVTTTLIALLAIRTASTLQAQIVTPDEARTVAENWVTLIVHYEGHWGGSETAAVDGTQELTRNQRLLGYFFSIDPSSYIVVSLRNELYPVKAYSTTGYFDPESDTGLADLIKTDMEHALIGIEEQADEVKSLLAMDYRSAWRKFGSDLPAFMAELDRGEVGLRYEPGTWMLTTEWHQAWPYNSWCPEDDCPNPDLNGHTWVGCTATAAAQIMRYWSWPPGRDWLNMPDSIDWDSPPEQIDAIAELSFAVGYAADMLYTCDWSFLLPIFMQAAMVNTFAYNAGHEAGLPHSVDGWHEILLNELNNDRPVLYGIGGQAHSVVVDGWRQVDDDLHWHLNYGWADPNNNTWYALDYPPIADAIVRDITPGPSIGPLLTDPNYPMVPYRYFEQHCTGTTTSTFAAGQQLQFLPGVKLRCLSSSPDDYIRFYGDFVHHTRLYAIKGTSSAAISIVNAGMRLRRFGGMRFHGPRAGERK